MSVETGYLSAAGFRHAIASVPLVSVDLLIVRDHHILLGRRRDEPARDTWFVPGGRIRRGESIGNALRRVWNNEIERAFPEREPRLEGVYEHQYDCAFDGSDVATHYVVLAHRFDVDGELSLRASSHGDCWWAPIAALPDTHKGMAVHPNAFAYLVALAKAPD